MVGLSGLSFHGWSEGFYLCFVASHPLPNAQSISLVVRDRLRPMEDLSENLPACLPPLLAELSMWHQTCSWLGCVQKLEGCRRVRTAGGLVRWATPSGMGGHSLVLAREAEKRPSGVGVAAAAAKLLQSCPTLCDPIDSSPPGYPVPGILQARTLEWVAISFSNT